MQNCLGKIQKDPNEAMEISAGKLHPNTFHMPLHQFSVGKMAVNHGKPLHDFGCWVLGEPGWICYSLRVQSLVFLGNTISLQLTAGALGRHGAGKETCHKELGTRLDEIVPLLLKWKSSIVESLNAHKI